jgi:hypothetical protein
LRPGSHGKELRNGSLAQNDNTLMGLLDRILNRRAGADRRAAASVPALVVPPPVTNVALLHGSHDLEVVGESQYQDALWRVAGGRTAERVRVEVQAVLHTEPDNPYDPNAIMVSIDGAKVGYLCRDDAQAYRLGLLALETRHRALIALAGVVVGGGMRQDGPGMLGVWLSHDPADFGITAIVPPPPAALAGSMRTGLTEALLTDAEDDSYDLSGLHGLPSDMLPAIRELRRLLEHDPDPIDRHFMFCELEDRLYRSRDVFSSALAEYDDTCRQHDAEMEVIREAFLAKFGKIPVLEIYRQMAIRQQKIKDWQQAIWWVERGLTLYGEHAARPESVDDLRKRLGAYRAKTSAPTKPSRKAPSKPQAAPADQTIEVLVCETCGASFDRVVIRGRKPKNCPACRRTERTAGAVAS